MGKNTALSICLAAGLKEALRAAQDGVKNCEYFITANKALYSEETRDYYKQEKKLYVEAIKYIEKLFSNHIITAQNQENNHE